MSLRALGIPLLLGVSTCASYSFAPLAPTAESIYQALWLSTGISLLTALAQSLIENTEENENRNTLRVTWTDTFLQGLRIAIVLAARYWCLGVLGPIRVCMLMFAGLGLGRTKFSAASLTIGWIGCLVLDLSQARDEAHAILVGLAYCVLFVSILLAPSSILSTTPFSLILAAGITSTPVLLHLHNHPLVFDLFPLLTTILFGSISLFLSRPTYTTPIHIHRLTQPTSTFLATLSLPPTPSTLLSLLPLPLLYHGIYSIPPTTSTTLYTKLRYHPLLKRVLHKEDSRKIFTFLCLNLAFMVIQMGYGVYTNSLGLVSDSIHMLVDCAAIAFGLGVSVLADEDLTVGVETVLDGHHHEHDHELEHVGTKHSPCDHEHEHGHTHSHSHDHSCSHSLSHADSHDHDHGHHHHHHHHHHPKVTGKYAKLEDLAGFANGIFLVLVCLSILSEALGRLIWPEEVVEVEQLLIVSILGLCVNLVGVFSFNHGHAGHSHDHNSNMHGIFLHVLADTLGSVGVIISTLLIRHFSWPGFDPLASILIAVLILISTVPLLKATSLSLLMINTPEKEYSLRDTLGEVGVTPGVSGVEGVKLWEGGGTVRVVVKKDDLGVVRERVKRVLSGKGGKEVCVDVVRG